MMAVSDAGAPDPATRTSPSRAAVLDEVCKAARTGRSVLVSGTWGSGKTTLLRAVTQALADDALPLGSERDLMAHAQDRRVVLIDDLDQMAATASRAVATRVSRGCSTVVSLSAGATVPVALDRALQVADGAFVRLGAMSRQDLSDLFESIGHGVTGPQLQHLHEHSGAIPAVAVALALGTGASDVTGRYRTDLATLTAGLRTGLGSAARRLFDLLSVTGGLPHRIARHMGPVGAHTRLERMGLVVTVLRPDGDDMRVAAPALAVAAGSMLGHVQRRCMLELAVDRCRQFDPPEPDMAHRIRRARWVLAVDGDLDLARNGLVAAMATGDAETVAELARQILFRDPADVVAAQARSIGLRSNVRGLATAR